MTLWIILTLMVAVSVAMLTIPLVRRHELRLDARAATLAVLRDQLGDVDRQVAAGTIPPGDAEGLRIEIKRRMLAAGHIPETMERSIGSPALAGVAIGLAALVAAAAGGLYASIGNPELGSNVSAAAPAAGQASANLSPGPGPNPDIARLITTLEKKVAARGNDPEGWRLLGWSYFQTGRYADAVTAYQKAVALKPAGPGFQSSLGEALVQVADGNVPPAAVAAFEAGVQQDGNDARARYFLALAKQQAGDNRGALADWLRLLGDSPADAPWGPQLRSVIDDAARAGGIDIKARLAAIKPRSPGDAGVAGAPGLSLPGGALPGSAAAAPGPSADQMAGAAAMAPADRQAMIRSMVDGLAIKLKAKPRDEAGWLRLMRARIVLGDTAAAGQARNAALAAFADDPGATSRIRAAATEMRIAG